MKLTINVTAEHIASGVAGDCGRCPIALAMEGQLHALRVYSTQLRYDGEFPWKSHYVSLPPVAREFIRDFDGDLPVAPFSFDLDLPEGAACPTP